MIKIVHPWAFWLLVLLPLLALLAWQKGRSSAERLRSLVAERLHFSLVGQVPTQRLRLTLILAGLGLAILAFARPQWGEFKEERKGRGRDVIIAVDVSRSMLASDLPPSRLKRAKLAAEDLVRQLPGDRIGLVAFAGSAFLQAPVTSDHAAILAAIQELDPDLIPLPGSNISDALRCVVDAFDHAEGGQRALILVSDGEELEADGLAVAKELAGQIRIFTVGVGTPEGAILQVPSPRGGMEYIRDEAGNVVLSHLDEKRLKELAEAGGGFYTRLLSGPAEMRHITQDGIMLMEEHDVQQEGKVRAQERYQWPLGAGLAFLGIGLLLGEKPRRKVSAGLAEGSKGKVAGVVLGILSLWVTLSPVGTLAATAREKYDAGDYPGSLEAFGAELARGPGSAARSYNLGTAAYKSGKWAEAIEAFGSALASPDSALKSKAEYNLANTLVQQARQGRRGIDSKTLEQAIAHYEEALRQDPRLEDASFNRDAVRRMLEKKEQQKQKGDKGDKKDSKDEQDKDKDQEKKDASKDEQSGEDKEDSKDSKSEEGKDEKDGKEGKDGQDQKGKPSKGDQGKDGKDGKDPQSGKPGDPQKSDKDEPGSTPKEEKAGDPKRRGELKNDPVAGGTPEGGKEKGGQEAQAQGGDGKLTKEQASALLEALRSEDRRVQLWTPDAKQQQQARSREGRSW